jgi:hypothetical protein
MTVLVRMKQGGSPLQVNFSDNFNRVNNNNLGSNWLRYLGGNDTVTLEAWGIATIVGNECFIQGQGENNPNAVLKTSWLPVPVLNSRFFNAPRVFAQATFRALAGTIGASMCIRYNQSHEAGPTSTANGMDGYLATFGGAGGRMEKITNGGAVTTIGANTVVNVAGDVVRIEAENSGTSTIIRTFVNGGVALNTVTELAAAFPIQRGWPGIVLWTVAGAPPSGSSLTLDNFSCGVF